MQMVRDEVLRPLEHPGEITDTQLAAGTKRERERQPRRISKCPERLHESLSRSLIKARRTQPLGQRQVDTQEIADVFSHKDILTCVDMITTCDSPAPTSTHPGR